MSLAAAIIIIVAFLVIVFAALALVMSRPKELRPHRPSWLGRGRGGGRRGRTGSAG